MPNRHAEAPIPHRPSPLSGGGSYEQGDLWFFPKGVPHHIQALADGVEFLLVFDDGEFSENSTFMISDFFAHTPKNVLAKNFGWRPEQLVHLPEKEKYIFQGQVPPPSAVPNRLGRRGTAEVAGRATPFKVRHDSSAEGQPSLSVSRGSATHSRWCRAAAAQRPPWGG